MNVGWRDRTSADEAMDGINADAVLVSIVADAVFLDPASIQVLLLQAICVFIPAIGQSASFDFRVLLSSIALLLLRRSLAAWELEQKLRQ